MITLTTPSPVNSVLGGAATVNYDRFVLSNLQYDTVNQTLAATIRLTSSANPDMQPILGRMLATVATAKLEIQVDQLDFYRRITLTGPQNTAIQNQIINAQNASEAGLVTLAVVAGVQTTGT